MRLLGAILAGGKSRRFGSDKAAAIIRGTAMLDHVAMRLRPQCDALVIAGRDWPGLLRVDDRPAPDLGPLGGLAGALAHARDHGFDAVLSVGCDLPGLPLDLRSRLASVNAIVRDQPTIGLWDAALADRLAVWLAETEDRSIAAWAEAAGVRRTALEGTIANINTPADLAAFSPPADPRSWR